MANALFDRMGIVGPGLIGGSLGMAVRSLRLARTVVGVGRRQASLDAALRLGAVDEVTLDAEAAVKGADLIVLATGVGRILEYLDALAPHFEAGAVVTDVGSVKASICRCARSILSRTGGQWRFVGGHPLAGSEQRGVEAATVDLFKAAVCILTPDQQTDSGDEGLARLSELWSALGAVVRHFEPAEHDRLLAEISHLPHVAAASLVNSVSHNALSLAASGFKDTTRVASGDPRLWVDICLENADSLIAALRALKGELDQFIQAAEERDASRLGRLLEQAKERRDREIMGL